VNTAQGPTDPADPTAGQAAAPYLRIPGERARPDQPAIPTGADFRERWHALDPAAREDIRRLSNRGEPSPLHRALMAAAWSYRLRGQRRIARAVYAALSVLLAFGVWRTPGPFRIMNLVLLALCAGLFAFTVRSVQRLRRAIVANLRQLGWSEV